MCPDCKKRPTEKTYRYKSGIEIDLCGRCWTFADWYCTNRESISQDGPEVKAKLLELGIL